MGSIDFVILWVDGADPEWLEEKNQYAPIKEGIASAASRFRDWDNLQYWFRGVEKYAPWVRKIHFVTWGHVPTWLNTDHPKINIVKHTDFIPKQYLPTFNSNAIELNLHRIPDLSETFVLFNDDMFLIDEVKEDDFFINGKPCDEMIADANAPDEKGMIIKHTNINNMTIINRHFQKRAVLSKNFNHCFNYRYGAQNMRMVCLLPWKHLVSFRNPHLPIAHLKSTFVTLWELESETMEETSSHRFRQLSDVSHWVMRYWNLCSGNFVPRSPKFGACFTAPKGTKNAAMYILQRKGKMICINDAVDEFDFEEHKRIIQSAFQSRLGVKCEFEK